MERNTVRIRESTVPTANLNEVALSVAQIVPFTEAEAPGVRFALWFRGVPCSPGYCNPEMLPFEGGTRMTVAAVLEQLEQAHRECGVEGITLLGGEPLAHAGGAVVLASAVRIAA